MLIATLIAAAAVVGLHFLPRERFRPGRRTVVLAVGWVVTLGCWWLTVSSWQAVVTERSRSMAEARRRSAMEQEYLRKATQQDGADPGTAR